MVPDPYTAQPTTGGVGVGTVGALGGNEQRASTNPEAGQAWSPGAPLFFDDRTTGGWPWSYPYPVAHSKQLREDVWVSDAVVVVLT